MRSEKYDKIMSHLVLTEKARERILRNVEEAAASLPQGRTSRAEEDLRDPGKKNGGKIIRFFGNRRLVGAAAAACVVFILGGVLMRTGIFNMGSAGPVQPSAAYEETAETEEEYAMEAAADEEFDEAVEEMAEEAAVPEAEELEEAKTGAAKNAGGELYDGTGAEAEESAEEESVQAVWQMEEASDVEELSRMAGFPVREITDLPFEAQEVTCRLITGSLAEVEYTSGEMHLTQRQALLSEGQEDISGDYTEYGRNEDCLYSPEDGRFVTSVTGEDPEKMLTIAVSGEGDRIFRALWEDDTYQYSLLFSEGVPAEELAGLIAQAIIG